MKPLIGIGADVHNDGRDYAATYLSYAQAVRLSGGVPLLIPPQPENAAAVLLGLDGLLLAGGADCDPSAYGEEKHPSCSTMDVRRQENDLALARTAREFEIPTLGICLGMQVMNVAAGGTLIQDIDAELTTEIRHASEPTDRGRHDVSIESGTRLSAILGTHNDNVNSSHHQAVKTLGRGFRVTAKAPDGIIEGLEDPRHPFYLGVQWHPEDMARESGAKALFHAFIEAATVRARARAARPAGVEG